MSKNDKLDAAINEDEARWQEIEQEMSKDMIEEIFQEVLEEVDP